ncbi:MAG: Glycosyltransferase [Candidatus Magasanikbacteria bacterium GW2011_GWC2_40_17]|uniref:Glycosyltransferase n=1 Tax=Candidatus Magasanikbacteria bacterium GW2011_GWA2_42_32 TaxID=1619039 RepID=A0A0G1A8W8_9BACT|nr:MAG: Glycosyltransferase [Candidatus Magasanikbacteria bacterium GW2011_GWC2_40_17]KKS57374.1 MAG: Glycosyltransferase [Candidatus Magasanikbacteria bacterium GW2011_GWA2_42_32]
MRILFTSGIFPPDIGGPARMIEQLATDLSQPGTTVTVLAFGQKDVVSRPFDVFKIQSKWFFCCKLWQLAREAEVIYTFDLYTAGFLSWLIGKKILKKKLVVRFAGDSAWESALNKNQTRDDIISFQKKKYGWQVELMKKIRRRILTEADQVVAVSNFMKDLAIKIGVKEVKVTVIYNAVDFVQNSLEPNQKTEGEKNIMTAGRLVPWKGIDGLIMAMSDLKKDQIAASFKLTVVGEGPDKSRLEKLSHDEGVNNFVNFVGKVPLDKISNYYATADVFILNSQYEGLSHVLLEVLSLGRPIIASSSGGNPEVIVNEKNGLLVEYNNLGQLKSAIKRILTEPYWQSAEYKQACRESLKKFNWQNVVEQTIKIFKNV